MYIYIFLSQAAYLDLKCGCFVFRLQQRYLPSRLGFFHRQNNTGKNPSSVEAVCWRSCRLILLQPSSSPPPQYEHHSYLIWVFLLYMWPAFAKGRKWGRGRGWSQTRQQQQSMGFSNYNTVIPSLCWTSCSLEGIYAEPDLGSGINILDLNTDRKDPKIWVHGVIEYICKNIHYR